MAGNSHLPVSGEAPQVPVASSKSGKSANFYPDRFR